jgi:hypothetical protein
VVRYLPRYFDNNAFADNTNLYGKSLTGDGTGSITGFNIPLYVSASLSLLDAVTAWVDVRAFGTIVLGAGASGAQKTANSNTIQAALNSLTTSGGDVRLPPGIIYIAGNIITINKTRTRLRGAGQWATELRWDNGVAVTASAGAVYLPQIEIGDFSLNPIGDAPGDGTKIGLKLIDTSWSYVHDFAVFGGPIASGYTGYADIGVQTMGREMLTMERFSVAGKQPLRVSKNPHWATIDMDFFNIRNGGFMTWDNAGAGITIDSNIYISNTTFENISIAAGRYGVYWVDTETTGVSIGLLFKNLRWEQCTSDNMALAWLMYIKHNSDLYNLTLDSVSGASDQATATVSSNGLYLRKVHGVTVRDSMLNGGTAGRYFMDIDNTVRSVTWSNVFAPNTGSFNLGVGVTEAYWRKAGLSEMAWGRWTGPHNTPTGWYDLQKENGFYTFGPLVVTLDNAAKYQVVYPGLVGATTDGWIYRLACASVSGYGLEGGTFLARHAATPVLLDNTANIGVDGAAGKISLDSLDVTGWVINNKIGSTYNCTIKVN